MASYYHSLAWLSFTDKNYLTFFMNSTVSQYFYLLTYELLCTINAKSFVMYPFYTVSITLLYKASQKTVSSGVLSSLARCRSPLVQAKMLAIELVDVYLPCCHWR